MAAPQAVERPESRAVLADIPVHSAGHCLVYGSETQLLFVHLWLQHRSEAKAHPQHRFMRPAAHSGSAAGHSITQISGQLARAPEATPFHPAALAPSISDHGAK